VLSCVYPRFLDVSYEVKMNALSAARVHLSVSDLVLINKPFVGFSWNSVVAPLTKSCGASMIFLKNRILYLKNEINFYPHRPYYLTDLDKILYGRSPRSANYQFRVSWKSVHFKRCFT
jgi:hypothetical protein